MNWYKNSIFYHIYPLGLCGCKSHNDFSCLPESKITEITKWIPHLNKLGVNAVYIGPIFESSKHGYDTADYRIIDRRLGTNDDFKKVCSEIHEAGIKIILDGVFNHVGRDFWAFKDVKINKWNSKYKDWFYIDFNRNSYDNDGFYYEGWEGHYDLVKLNLANEDLRNHLFDCISNWIDEFDIDGLRLDVAYCIDRNFLRDLKSFTKSKKEDFFLLGEMIHGNYNDIVKPDLLDSATNYECYKGIHSSLNCKNMFEIQYSINRQFANGGLYSNLPLYNFIDNHDVSRISTILENKNLIKHAFALLMTMPGIPSIYYGSEWGIEGNKKNGDDSLRPSIDISDMTDSDLTEIISKLNSIRISSPALCIGDYKMECLTNNQLVFSRSYDKEKIIVALNIEDTPFDARVNIKSKAIDLLSEKEDEEVDINNVIHLEKYGIEIFKIEN